ncbi:MAG: crossover junction endodeoxyribonuclease RuvC [Bacteroidales bacterium]|nr:crossover junction endodeoxyribonuclease RuvC [Bacteroidales bacterium]
MGYGVVRVGACSRPEYVDMGVLDLRRFKDPYDKLRQIFDFTTNLCRSYGPTDLAIESPFYGKNAQVIFKLGRAQGAAIVAAEAQGLDVYEYAPRKAKIAICGNGAASKEQVCLMVQKTLGVRINPGHLDATDALGLAMCHYYQLTNPLLSSGGGTSSWEKFVASNPDRVKP